MWSRSPTTCRTSGEIPDEIEVRKDVSAGRLFSAVTAVQAATLDRPGLKMELDVVAVMNGG